MQVILITEVKTADLVKFWNENCQSVQGDYNVVKKFADRMTAEKRIDILVGKMDFEGVREIPEGFMPAPEGYEGQELAAEYLADGAAEEEKKPAPTLNAGGFSLLVQQVQDAQKAIAESGEPLIKKDTGSKAANSEGVAASWADGEVRAARLRRNSVSVELDGKNVGVFKSTYEAFRALRLPNNKHIRFRLRLKEAHRDNGGTATFEHNGKNYVFSITEVEAE